MADMEALQVHGIQGLYLVPLLMTSIILWYIPCACDLCRHMAAMNSIPSHLPPHMVMIRILQSNRNFSYSYSMLASYRLSNVVGVVCTAWTQC